ncbi:hypothetical protein SEA_BLINN1_74 [Mycobacterium phage Blinn1]|uniref:Uncharacterized protein n=1 Tax=Mycobacterium phage Blinn1 TaxID=2656562 RepID=A0A649VRL0_9CAUD|nr:hypothetical protein KIP53_gp035 [Mycobacterium phage Blinn1]QGJ94834.1 hypothetical protein SEA_BLINN1_74 [Mycobacterium phage Blinn1]
MDDDEECGYSYDHDEEVVDEDDEYTYLYCRRCGAEWEEPH